MIMVLRRGAGVIMVGVTQMCVIQVLRLVRGRVARLAWNNGERRAGEPAGGKAKRNEDDECAPHPLVHGVEDSSTIATSVWQGEHSAGQKLLFGTPATTRMVPGSVGSNSGFLSCLPKKTANGLNHFGGGGIRSKFGTSSGVLSHAARPLV
jgi:hypothetical protein